MTVSNDSSEQYRFDLEAFFPRAIFDRITDVRVDTPEMIVEHAQRRRRRSRLAPNGKLAILAADHPGRGVTGVAGMPMLMGDRYQYIGRILRVLLASDFDGFMSTHDMIDELLIVDYLIQAAGGPSFLDDKVLIGCMQRGGIVDTEGEFDDRFGCYSAESLARFNLDGGKMLLRFLHEDERTLKTVQYCADAVTALNRYELTPFIEPLDARIENGRYVYEPRTEIIVKLVGVCSALGDASYRTWLKLPYTTDFETVTMATTMPILMLGGPSKGDPRDTYADFAAAMSTRPNVRGALVGRNVSFPGPEDPAAVAQAIYEIVHNGLSAEEASAYARAHRDRNIDALTRYLS